MLERIARIIVTRRRRFFIGALILTAICGYLALQVGINYDMTKYLPDSSSMKRGLDIMTEEFPEMATESTIRVMFDDLPPDERIVVFEKLDAIPYVESVSYERDSADYNKGNHTLFVVSVPYAYGTAEELAVEETIDTGFTEYTMVWHNDDTATPGLTLTLALVAVALLALILFLMCPSWIEPALFLMVIGIAVVINLGTNIVMGEISTNTFQMAAILQLVLSMDYSIILMSRYRIERGNGECSPEERENAMVRAFTAAFASIASSSLTTVVGLLMLCFMSFKIGIDLGVVLAKGVFISMLAVLLLLPGIILAADGLVMRSAKKVLHFNMDRVAGFCYRFRYPLTAALVILFVGVLILQSRTSIAYTLVKDDDVADVFPADNMVLVVYENTDEGQIPALVERLEADPLVKSVTAYATVLGKPYTVTELAKMLTSTGADLPIGEGILGMLYYDFFTEGEPPAMTAGEFLRFLAGTVATDETFADYLTPEMRDSLETLGRFADADSLTTPYTADEMAAFLEMDPEDMRNLYLLYFIEKGGVSLPSMTLPTFVHFVLHEVAADPEYASMFPAGSLSQLRRLETFTNASAMTAPRDYRSMANLMGLDAETAKLLYAYYMANQPGFDPGAVSRADFMDFLNNDLLGSSLLESYVDAETLALIRAAASEAQSTDGTVQETPEQLAADMGVDVATVTSVMKLDAAGDVSARQMAVGAFLSFAEGTALGDPVVGAVWSATDASRVRTLRAAYSSAAAGEEGAADALAEALGADDATVEAILDGAAYTPADMAGLLGVDVHAVSLTYGLAFAPDVSGLTMSRREFAEAALNVGAETALADSALAGLVTPEILSRIQNIQQQIGTDDDSPVTYRDLMDLLGVDETTAKVICTMAASGREADSWRISCQNLVNFLVANSSMLSVAMSASELSQMKTLAAIINGSVAGTPYTYGGLAGVLGMSSSQARQIYTLYASRHGDTSGWTITVEDLVHFLDDEVLTNEDYASRFDEETAAYVPALRSLVDAVVSGRLYEAAEMAELLGAFSEDLDPNMVELLYLYHASSEGADPTWRISIEQLFTFLNEDLVNDPRFVEVIDDDMRAQLRTAADELAAGKAQLVTRDHARLIITSSYPEEGPDTLEFLTDLDAYVTGHFAGEAHLVGNSVMMYEMQSTFGKEFLFISALTALAIFIIVALSFRSLIVPLILVLLVQCGVYATMCVIGWMSGSMFYLALLIVECILMGSTIDYGILFSTFYRESRAAGADIPAALRAGFAGSTHTILTSGSIIILVCGAMSFLFEEPSIGAICRTISIGAFVVILLIFFVLPGVLAALDKLVVGKAKTDAADELHAAEVATALGSGSEAPTAEDGSSSELEPMPEPAPEPVPEPAPEPVPEPSPEPDATSPDEAQVSEVPQDIPL